MFVRNPALVEFYSVSRLMVASKEDIRCVVNMFNITSLRFRIDKARMQEKSIEVALKKIKQLRPILKCNCCKER